MKYFLPFAILLGALVAAAQIAGQVPTTGQVPDESVVPQWSATFETLLKARETHFLDFRVPKLASGPLSDADLIDGIASQPSDVPRLEGAEDCVIKPNPLNGITYYRCFFVPVGRSAVDMQQDFIRLVRLVEKATGGSAQQGITPLVTRTMEVRDVTIGKIKVIGRWLPEISATALERMHQPLDNLSRLSVFITSDASPAASISGSSEINEIIKSGRYTHYAAGPESWIIWFGIGFDQGY